MYLLETNIFWPNPHPIRTHHMKFPAPSPGHSPTVAWRMIFYLFNSFFFFQLSHSSSFSNHLVCILFSWLGPFLLHPLGQYCVCSLSWKLFVNNEIRFTWFGAVNAPGEHRESPWPLPGPDVVAIQLTTGCPGNGKMCTVVQAAGKQAWEAACLNAPGVDWLLSPLPRAPTPRKGLASRCRIIRSNKKRIPIKSHAMTQIPVFYNR